jgi:hypothetical protein
MAAPVELWITGTNGDQESHLAHTLDVTDQGIRLAGFRCELKTERQLGAECVEPEKDIWGVEFPEKEDEYEEKD